ncbi:Glycerophosphodiester phosphodiesterase protein [Dioscorea alata]|uniref:Glycerophosphodiester phosphodiesterase protein n=1 Tax=Dioscorea alata TaxID=55571 RepID=A0ACB7UG59_DIOAL|nr:Glycerophosphodiester phosphodiesterase protein [Dioscorea alata]
MMILLPSPAVPSALQPAFLLLLFLFFLSNSTIVSAGDYCAPSSCGNITNIRNPFRLKDDPLNCGDPNYELTCDHLNHTILPLLSNSYYVTNITYDDEDFFNIKVKDIGTVKYNNRSCHLPFLPSPLTVSKLRSNDYYRANEWVPLVNCSKKVKNKSMHHFYNGYNYFYEYRPVPCLSHNNSFIYLIIGGPYNSYYEVGGLMPSCRFVLWAPVILSPSILLVVFGRCVLAPLTIWAFLSYKLYQMMSSIDVVEKFLRNQQTLVPTRYSYSDIIAMTGHFNEKIGQGGFGSVFKGRLPFGKLVAIKMLTNSKYAGEDFINEVSTIGRIHHINVVKLIGFCSDDMQRALVYEYMQNGSLDKFIFLSNNGSNHKLSSNKLIDIALGVARGINYLHKRIGTIGYIAPEQISRSLGIISHKCDIFSFGMLLLEMAGGRRNSNPKAENTSQVYYPSWIYVNLLMIQLSMIWKLSMIGLWCIQIRPSDRPSMSKVIEMLEGDVGSL